MLIYTLHDNESYRLLDESPGEILFVVGPPPLIAIGFSWDGTRSVMHKHGSPKPVEAWRKRQNAAYKAAGLNDELYTIIGELDVDSLNRIIDTTGYLDLYLRDAGCLEAMDGHPDCRSFELLSKDGWTGWAPVGAQIQQRTHAHRRVA